MPFVTSLKFYRPVEPPRITGDDLARFVAQFADLNMTTAAADRPRLWLQVKFGAAIDQDNWPADRYEPVNERISVVDAIEWDLDIRCSSLAEIGSHLEANDQPIYRAHLSLGDATAGSLDDVQRVDSTENDVDLVFDSWAVEIGPILCSDLASENPVDVGWLSLNLCGNGYLYPWSFAELLARVEANDAIRRVTDLCRATWPVAPDPPDAATCDQRGEMGELWPYPTTDLPWDWYWGIEETD